MTVKINFGSRHDGALQETGDLDKVMGNVRQDMLQLNALISANGNAERALASEACTLEMQCLQELKVRCLGGSVCQGCFTSQLYKRTIHPPKDTSGS
jgi:hypothetical protein